MGLDMYLQGHLYRSKYNDDYSKMSIDNFPIKEIIVELGYWRKHPNLHGFIVKNFADGTDDCTPIQLSTNDLTKILDAVTANVLPDTQGFFFGESAKPGNPYYEQELQITKDQLANAILWLKNEGAPGSPGVRWVTYRASW